MTRLCLTGGLMLGAIVSSTAAQDGAGSARISKARKTPVIQQMGFDDVVEESGAYAAAMAGPPSQNWNLVVQPVGKSREMEYYGGFDGDCPGGCESGFGGHCPSCGKRGCFGRGGWCNSCGHYHGNCNGRGLFDYLHCKFGGLCPSGKDGKGAPWFGKYSRVYPQDVNYFDQRDGQIYAAQGYGVPIAVPLAPVVGHTYNYSWGTPSSRLTPISTVAPRY